MPQPPALKTRPLLAIFFVKKRSRSRELANLRPFAIFHRAPAYLAALLLARCLLDFFL
jgi:hypothetical protein